MPQRIDGVQQDITKGIQICTFSNSESRQILGKGSEKNTELLWLPNGLIMAYKPEHR